MCMKRYYYSFLVSGFLLLSCGTETTDGDLPEFPVDKEESASLLLSEIAESITAIELELTDESLIWPQRGRTKRIIVSDDMIFLAQSEKVFVFNMDGKYIRSIGSKGQGPGEYNEIRNFAMDEINKRLFVNAYQKIICYDLAGNYKDQMGGFSRIVDINYINNELLVIDHVMGMEDEQGLFNHDIVYRFNDEFQILDSCTIQKIYMRGFSESPIEDYILYLDSTVYLYYPCTAVPTPETKTNPVVMQRMPKTVLRDTLYRFENNQLVPELKLKFKNDGTGGDGYLFINLVNVFRSSRYIFAEYLNYLLDYDFYYPYFCFCYDTKTGTGYNMRDGYTDDIHQIEKVRIRPFHTNPEMFYYWHTHMKPNDLEEPNPTLYIGTLKK